MGGENMWCHTKSALGRVRNSCMLVLHLCCMLCDGHVTACSSYQTNAVQVHIIVVGPWPLSSLAYPMITCTPLVAGNLPIKTLVATFRCIRPCISCTPIKALQLLYIVYMILWKLCGHKPMNNTVGHGVVLTDCAAHLQPHSHMYDHCVNETWNLHSFV
jgi:hypothetical protein